MAQRVIRCAILYMEINRNLSTRYCSFLVPDKKGTKEAGTGEALRKSALLNYGMIATGNHI